MPTQPTAVPELDQELNAHLGPRSAAIYGARLVLIRMIERERAAALRGVTAPERSIAQESTKVNPGNARGSIQSSSARNCSACLEAPHVDGARQRNPSHYLTGPSIPGGPGSFGSYRLSDAGSIARGDANASVTSPNVAGASLPSARPGSKGVDRR